MSAFHWAAKGVRPYLGIGLFVAAIVAMFIFVGRSEYKPDPDDVYSQLCWSYGARTASDNADCRAMTRDMYTAQEAADALALNEANAPD